MIFRDRIEAGQLLTKKLEEFTDKPNVVVLAIPRGGLVIGKQLVDILGCPLDVIVTKKIGSPGDPEMAIGAVGTKGEPVVNEDLAMRMGANQEYLQAQISQIKAQIKEKEDRLRAGKSAVELKDKLVIITDDGVATGATIKAAIKIVRQQEPKRIVVAVPVIARDSLMEIEREADEVIYLEAPKLFFSVGQFYQNFAQVSDEEAEIILKER